MPGLRRVVAP